MGHTFYGKHGYYFNRNVAAGDFLAKITLGLWDKIGCHPKTDEDCKLVARILRNRIKLNEYLPYAYFEQIYGLTKEDDFMVRWMRSLANFFELCGYMDEGDFYYKYKNGKEWRVPTRLESDGLSEDAWMMHVKCKNPLFCPYCESIKLKQQKESHYCLDCKTYFDWVHSKAIYSVEVDFYSPSSEIEEYANDLFDELGESELLGYFNPDEDEATVKLSIDEGALKKRKESEVL